MELFRSSANSPMFTHEDKPSWRLAPSEMRAMKRWRFFGLIVALAGCDIVASGGDSVYDVPIRNPCNHSVSFKERIGKRGPQAQTLTIGPKQTLIFSVDAPDDTLTL